MSGSPPNRFGHPPDRPPQPSPLPTALTSLSLQLQPTSPRPQLVYLDQFIWIDLLRRLKARDHEAANIRDRLHSLRSTNKISVPLSASHYLELWHRADGSSRLQLAALMRDLSRYDTIAPIQVVHQYAVTAAVHAVFDETPPAEPLYLGAGVEHAYDSPTGRLRPVESIATERRAEGEPVDVGPMFRDAAGATDRWEWISLAGPEELFSGLGPDGLDRWAQHRVGDAQVERESQLRTFLEAQPHARNRLRDFIVTDEFINTLDHINDAADKLGRDLHPFLLRHGPEAIRWFVNVIPTSNTLAVLREMRLRNPTHPIDQHDSVDLLTLANVVPNCDVVVTERRWCHGIRQRQLDERYGTTMLSSLSQLARWLTEHPNESN